MQGWYVGEVMKKTIVFNHLGFPIRLVDCPHVWLFDGWAPDIQYNLLQDVALMRLSVKPGRLTGAELKFIRKHLDMTREQFAAWLGDGARALLVQIWEDWDLEPCGLPRSMERSLRLEMLAKSYGADDVPAAAIRRILDATGTDEAGAMMELTFPLSYEKF